MDHRESILEPGDGTYRHAMRDQHDRNTALLRCKIKGNAVRIAVIRSHGKSEISAAKKIEVTCVVTKQFDHTHGFEGFKTSMHPPRNLIDGGNRSGFFDIMPGGRWEKNYQKCENVAPCL